MCIVSDKIKFCTCATTDVEKLKHYWKLYRFNKNKDIMILGETMCPSLLLIINYEVNQNTILSRINEEDAFDIPLEFQSKDILEIVLNNDVDIATYTFEYKKGKWKISAANYFEIANNYDEEQSGKIKSALKRKI